jgi:uncharacterized protein (UPF0264 family)
LEIFDEIFLPVRARVVEMQRVAAEGWDDYVRVGLVDLLDVRKIVVAGSVLDDKFDPSVSGFLDFGRDVF